MAHPVCVDKPQGVATEETHASQLQRAAAEARSHQIFATPIPALRRSMSRARSPYARPLLRAHRACTNSNAASDNGRAVRVDTLAHIKRIDHAVATLAGLFMVSLACHRPHAVDGQNMVATVTASEHYLKRDDQKPGSNCRHAGQGICFLAARSTPWRCCSTSR